MSRDERGRDRSEVSTSPRKTKNFWQLPESRKQQGTDSPPRPPEGTHPAGNLILDFEAPELFKTMQVFGSLLLQPQETNADGTWRTWKKKSRQKTQQNKGMGCKTAWAAFYGRTLRNIP